MTTLYCEGKGNDKKRMRQTIQGKSSGAPHFLSEAQLIGQPLEKPGKGDANDHQEKDGKAIAKLQGGEIT